jgi:hypothetical protein
MADESTADFLNGISEKPELFKEEDSATKETVESDVEDDKPLPFYKDPKVQRYIEKQIEKRIEKLPTAEQSFRKEVAEEINLPASFVKLIGNDTDEKRQVLKDMAEYLGSIPKKAQEEFLAQQQEAVQQQIQEDNAAVAELDDAFESIEENYDVDLSSNAASAKALRASFIEYIRKIAPKNEDGEVSAFPDMESAFESFQEMQKRPSASRAKELASRGMTRSNETTTVSPRGNSWRDVDKYFERLSKNT